MIEVRACNGAGELSLTYAKAKQPLPNLISIFMIVVFVLFKISLYSELYFHFKFLAHLIATMFLFYFWHINCHLKFVSTCMSTEIQDFSSFGL